MNKKRVLLYKPLVLGIIILLIGISISPVITAIDIDKDTGDNSMDNSNENRKHDVYKEIITLVYGSGNFHWIFRRGLFRGEADIWVSEYDKLFLNGYRFSKEGNVEYYFESVGDIYVYHYRGFHDETSIFGIALGNIDW